MTRLQTGVACRICHATESLTVLEGHDHREGMPGRFAVVQCRACGVARVEPWPTDPLEWYPPSYQQHSAQTATGRVVEWAMRTANAPGARSGEWRLLSRLVPDCDLGGPVAPTSTILDVGAGNGAAVRALRQAGLDAYGIEPEPRAVEAAQRAGVSTVRRGTLEDNPYGGQRFDVVRMFQVLEHVPDPVEAISLLAGVLAPGGRAVIGVPNFASLGRRVFAGSWDGLELPRHLHHFTPSSLTTVLHRGGLHVDGLHTVALFGLLAASLDARRSGGLRQSGLGRSVVLRTALYPVELTVAALGAGDGLMAVARHPDGPR